MAKSKSMEQAISEQPNRARANGEHPADEFITMAEMARAINVHPATVGRWIKDGLLNAVRMPSGIFRLRKSEANKFLGGTALPMKEIA